MYGLDRGRQSRLYIGHGIVIKSDLKGRYLWVKEVPARSIFLRTRLSSVPEEWIEIFDTGGIC